MGMYSDQVYKRSLGMRYDADALRREIASGVAGYTGDFDRTNGFEQTASDLYVETAPASESEIRLQEIEFELAGLLNESILTDETVEQVLLLEAEKVVRLEEQVEELLAGDSVRAQALKDLFMTRLIERAEAGQPVDGEMFAESDELATHIATQYPEQSSADLVEIAERMEALIVAQLTLEQHIDSDELSAAHA